MLMNVRVKSKEKPNFIKLYKIEPYEIFKWNGKYYLSIKPEGWPAISNCIELSTKRKRCIEPSFLVEHIDLCKMLKIKRAE